MSHSSEYSLQAYPMVPSATGTARNILLGLFKYITVR